MNNGWFTRTQYDNLITMKGCSRCKWSADWPAHEASCSVTHLTPCSWEATVLPPNVLSPYFVQSFSSVFRYTIEMRTIFASYRPPCLTTPTHQRTRTLHLVLAIDSWDNVSPLLKSIFFVRKSHSCGAEMRDVTKYGCCCESWHKCNQLTQFQTQKLPLPHPHPSND